MCHSDNVHKKNTVELADIFRMHGKKYCEINTLTPEQYKVMHAIVNCRTSVLGGHIDKCNHCGKKQCAYNSCRNRHCPKCETFKATKWLEEKQRELLPVSYFHVVFTIPHELNTLVLYNKAILYSLLFQSAWETLRTLGKTTKQLEGEMGMLSILHTWSQTLYQHNHVHCIVPGGALTSEGKWNHSRKKYLFPVKVMSAIFRGIYISKLREAFKNQKLTMPPPQNSNDFDTLLNVVMKKNWIVYIKEPFAGPEKLLNYLGRYTHKIAISNYRILACDNEFVTFKWRDYSDNNKIKVMQLKPNEFIRRFLSHVVPNRFMRIRSYGFLANACKNKKITVIQKQLSHQPKKRGKKKDTREIMLKLTGNDILICPFCKQGRLMRIEDIPKKFGKTVFDTS